MTNSIMIKQLIKKSGIDEETIAKSLKISPWRLEKKLDNAEDFTAEEMNSLCGLLNIVNDIDKEQIFFAAKVEKMPTYFAL